MDVRECLEKGLLKRDAPSMEKSRRSLEVAQKKVTKARELLKANILDMAEVSIYSSMFHASRALLFRDGFKERSHYAIYVYLKEKYADKLDLRFLNELNILRLNRHEIFYGFDEPEVDEGALSKTIVLAEEFIRIIQQLVAAKSAKR